MEERRIKIEVLQSCSKLLNCVGLDHKNGVMIGRLTTQKRIVRFWIFFVLMITNILMFDYCFDRKFDLKIILVPLIVIILCVRSLIDYSDVIIGIDLIHKSIDHLKFIVNESNYSIIFDVVKS